MTMQLQTNPVHVQAFLEGQGTPKAKRRLIKKLAGSFASLALSPGGSFLTEACYAAGVSSPHVVTVMLGCLVMLA